MRLTRASGVLLHPTSLPSRFGVGDLGPGSDAFIRFLRDTGQTWWQMLPVGPTGYGNSPYQSTSSYAGNPLLISPELLAIDGLLTANDWSDYPDFSIDNAQFEELEPLKERLLRKAFTKFDARNPSFLEYRVANAHWLDDFSLYRALKDENGGAPWYDWERRYASRDSKALASSRTWLRGEIQFHEFVQYQFDKQWKRLRATCEQHQIRLIGDVPIFVAHDSADVWARPDLFFLDEHGKPTVVAGVPPDLFSKTGQLWGNPLYDWKAQAEEGFAWWIARMKGVTARVDLVRLDHFRGFQAYWEVPGDAETAVGGRWILGPGSAFLDALRDGLGGLPLIAEDLGLITPEVEVLRDEFDLPGMRILQFAFGNDAKTSHYLPHNYVPNSVAYTGSHDNDTAVGWYHTRVEDAATTQNVDQMVAERNFATDYLASDRREIHWDMIRAVAKSVADTMVIPLQDLLGLGSEARMNVPGRAEGNWRWRFTTDAIGPDVVSLFAVTTSVSGRWNGVPPTSLRYPRFETTELSEEPAPAEVEERPKTEDETSDISPDRVNDLQSGP